MTPGKKFSEWHDQVVLPRLMILRLLPSAGAAPVLGATSVNVALGLLPFMFINATSSLIGQVPSAIGNTNIQAYRALLEGVVWIAVTFLLQQCLVPIQVTLAQTIGRRVDARLRDDTVRLGMRSTGIGPMEDPDTLNALGEATRLLDSGAHTPGMACAGMLALIARYGRLTALLWIVADVVSWSAALVLGAVTLLLRHGQRGGLRKYAAVWREVAGTNRRARYLRELALGNHAAKETRVFGLLDWLRDRYADSYLAAHATVSARRRSIYLKPYLFYAPIALVAAGAVMGGVAQLAAAGHLSLTELALALQAAAGALLLGEYYPEADAPTQFGMQAVAALAEVQDRIAEAEAPGRARLHRLCSGMPATSLELDNVSFEYPGATRQVLQGFSITLPIGQCTALVGVNGAGKSTLVKLLTRLHEPSRGCIRVDGINLADLDPVAWRRQVSVVFQDFLRYELTAADNIALGAAHVARDRARIEKAAARAGILDAFAHLPRGLDTPMSRAYEGGIDLSGGQWQRIALARSLYAVDSGARLLILDEPTAALDVRAEGALFNDIIELTRDATVLLISHRLSSVRRADGIAVIHRGAIAERGAHSALLSANGLYAELFRLQARRFVNGKSCISSEAIRSEGHASESQHAMRDGHASSERHSP